VTEFGGSRVYDVISYISDGRAGRDLIQTNPHIEMADRVSSPATYLVFLAMYVFLLSFSAVLAPNSSTVSYLYDVFLSTFSYRDPVCFWWLNLTDVKTRCTEVSSCMPERLALTMCFSQDFWIIFVFVYSEDPGIIHAWWAWYAIGYLEHFWLNWQQVHRFEKWRCYVIMRWLTCARWSRTWIVSNIVGRPVIYVLYSSRTTRAFKNPMVRS